MECISKIQCVDVDNKWSHDANVIMHILVQMQHLPILYMTSEQMSKSTHITKTILNQPLMLKSMDMCKRRFEILG